MRINKPELRLKLLQLGLMFCSAKSADPKLTPQCTAGICEQKYLY